MQWCRVAHSRPARSRACHLPLVRVCRERVRPPVPGARASVSRGGGSARSGFRSAARSRRDPPVPGRERAQRCEAVLPPPLPWPRCVLVPRLLLNVPSAQNLPWVSSSSVGVLAPLLLGATCLRFVFPAGGPVTLGTARPASPLPLHAQRGFLRTEWAGGTDDNHRSLSVLLC